MAQKMEGPGKGAAKTQNGEREHHPETWSVVSMGHRHFQQLFLPALVVFGLLCCEKGHFCCGESVLVGSSTEFFSLLSVVRDIVGFLSFFWHARDGFEKSKNMAKDFCEGYLCIRRARFVLALPNKILVVLL